MPFNEMMDLDMVSYRLILGSINRLRVMDQIDAINSMAAGASASADGGKAALKTIKKLENANRDSLGRGRKTDQLAAMARLTGR